MRVREVEARAAEGAALGEAAWMQRCRGAEAPRRRGAEVQTCVSSCLASASLCLSLAFAFSSFRFLAAIRIASRLAWG